MTAHADSDIPTSHAALTTKLARAFQASGEELYLVGGAVRDRLLGRLDIDLDFATSATPDRTVTTLGGLGMGSPYRVGEKFGTIGLRVGDRLVEITTYRSAEHYEPGSRKPIVEFGRSIDEDLSRRDFTINAMAENALTGETIDPLGGAKDLAAGLIRAVGEAQDRFREDPLRLLRAVRFASRLGFAIAPDTWEAMTTTAPTLEQISRERVRDEYSRMLLGPDPVRALTLLRDSGLMRYSVPQLLALDTMPDHGPRHPLSLWDHTMRVVAGVPSVLSVRWAALLHDIAKPVTRTHEPSGRPRFFHHEEVGAATAREILTGLRYSNAELESVVLLVETHMQLHAYTPEWSEGAVRRLRIRLGALTDLALALARADGSGHSLSGTSANSPKFDELEARLRSLDEEQRKRPSSPLTGNDLMERYHRPPGPWIKQIKERICDAIIDGALDPTDVEGAWRIADAEITEEP